MALTATATALVQKDVKEQLCLREPVLQLRASVFRPNLRYDVVYSDALNGVSTEQHLVSFILTCLGNNEQEVRYHNMWCTRYLLMHSSRVFCRELVLSIADRARAAKT